MRRINNKYNIIHQTLRIKKGHFSFYVLQKVLLNPHLIHIKRIECKKPPYYRFYRLRSTNNFL